MNNRYTVAASIFDSVNGEKKKYIILDQNIPAVTLNVHLIIRQERFSRPVSSEAYNLCMFLNSMDDVGIDILDATMEDIYSYLSSAYVDDCKSYHTIRSYIISISALYESLARRGFHLHYTLYRPEPIYTINVPARVLMSSKDKLTKVSLLKYEFVPRKTDAPQNSYTKWYSPEEIDVISSVLQFPYRCIFLDTIYTGHRIDSALSITLDTLSMRERQIWPTRTKTGKSHKSLMPPALYDCLQTYLYEVRSRVVAESGSTSVYLFLGKDGNPVTYQAYYKALKSAGEKINSTKMLDKPLFLHTHAGRSTFAAALRTYQLSQQRKGVQTFSDTDFCNLMDWKSLQCLENYDIATRAQEVSPLLEEFYKEFPYTTNQRKGDMVCIK